MVAVSPDQSIVAALGEAEHGIRVAIKEIGYIVAVSPDQSVVPAMAELDM
jgi:hypothetical protein